MERPPFPDLPSPSLPERMSTFSCFIRSLRVRPPENRSAHAATGIVPGTVKLFKQDAAPTGSSTPIATGSFAANDGRLTLTPASPITIARNTTIELWITINVVGAGGETIGTDFRFQVPD